MTLHGAKADHPQPKTAIPLTHQYGLCRPFAMGLQQRHTELFSHLSPPGALAQPSQQGVDLGERHKTGSLGVGHQDQAIEPLHVLQQILNVGQQIRERKSQEGPSFFIFSSASLGRCDGLAQALQAKLHARSFKRGASGSPFALQPWADAGPQKTQLDGPAPPVHHPSGSVASSSRGRRTQP